MRHCYQWRTMEVLVMTKKHFIALADAIRGSGTVFTDAQLQVLVRFCIQQNRNFLPERWLGYINGTCGPCGGDVR